MRTLLTQLSKFGTVGLIGFGIDVGLFTLLSVTVLTADTHPAAPLWAKVISTSVAILFNWVGNRHWTFARENRAPVLREGIQFVVVSIGGMLIALACLGISRYVLGFDTVLADNISSNGVGLVLGTAFRFWMYRVWVFGGERA